jgi:hypothetical protein
MRVGVQALCAGGDVNFDPAPCGTGVGTRNPDHRARNLETLYSSVAIGPLISKQDVFVDDLNKVGYKPMHKHSPKTPRAYHSDQI